MFQNKHKNMMIAAVVLILGTCAVLVYHSLADSGEGMKVTKNSSRAPENLPVETINSDHMTNRGKLAITIDHNAAVELLPAVNEQLAIEYAKKLYDVSMEQQGDVWNIHISYKGEYSKYPSAVLRIPVLHYANVSLHTSEATVYLKQAFQYCKNLKAELKDTTTYYELPANFHGEVNMAISDGYFELSSVDEYRNTNISIKNVLSMGNISDKFQEINQQLRYTQGTEIGSVNIDCMNSSYLIIK